MRGIAALVAAAVASACAAMPAEEAPREAGVSAYRCRAEPLGDLVGRTASQALGTEALRLSGARVLRWIRPGDVITMDYSEERLNIRLDAAGKVARFTCG